jgi:hypothetical protein
MEPKVDELCKFKIWFYGSVIASGFSVIMFLVSLFIKK